MPLELLLALVVLGIAGIAALLHALGYTAGLTLDSEDAVRAQWQRLYPDDDAPGAIHLSADGRAALVETGDGPGLIWVMGADSTAHKLTGADLRDTPDGLYIDLHDFAAPGLNVRLGPEARAIWRALIPTPDRAAPARHPEERPA